MDEKCISDWVHGVAAINTLDYNGAIDAFTDAHPMSSPEVADFIRGMAKVHKQEWAAKKAARLRSELKKRGLKTTFIVCAAGSVTFKGVKDSAPYFPVLSICGYNKAGFYYAKAR